MLDGSMSHLGADRPCEHSSLLGGAVFATSIASAQSFTPFTSEHAARGVIYNMMFTPPLDNPQDGFGMAAADLDGDGDLDLVLLGRADGLVGLYENNGVGIFTNRSATSAIAATAAGAGVSAFDYDSDGDLDLYLAQKNRASKLWRNDGALSFTDVTRAAGLELTAPVTGTSVADYDGDGWLDLAVCVYSASQANKLYRNQGDGTFAEVGAALGVASPRSDFPTPQCGAITTATPGLISASATTAESAAFPTNSGETTLVCSAMSRRGAACRSRSARWVSPAPTSPEMDAAITTSPTFLIEVRRCWASIRCWFPVSATPSPRRKRCGALRIAG